MWASRYAKRNRPYRAGADGKSRPFEGDFETELEAFSRSSGVSMKRLRANRFMETMYKLANEAYDIGAIDRAICVYLNNPLFSIVFCKKSTDGLFFLRCVHVRDF